MNRRQLGDAPIEASLHGIMNKIAGVLDTALNGEAKGEARKNGFILIVFPFDEAESAKAGQGGRANYISNANRDDVLIMLKEQVKRFEGQPEIEGKA